ncbi:hypothetical protein H0I83_29920 (plasmid) [Bacillus thuringiensis serovar fukuokaensis]|uniref:hypothetical protein n=1 Tax=Bacillus cereus group TaxID=86661 RepID=UPI000A36EC95|nr:MULTISPECIES: hypothetical protein [Bacillus cereus group]MEB9738896.1 hypothetical protein [Bacillus cereus]OTW81382.1 hypothetical protein BK710_21660 [Bacillus thuringiensis serovar sumiyoshiensis]OTW81422.1 hypothetical protein BK713_16425 [Bacillus thuringiensis serovar jinghongiensis]OTW84345.1 hypothetical protein BK713_08740 [Bacillus thuringiensis serovar jinghongiensis]OTW84397.1 hypothetical protein BK713_08635 [Bacillus thuringiensis serovar jinghongiensis]
MGRQRDCECDRCKRYSSRRLFNLYEGDWIKVYSAGVFEGEGTFIRFTEEKDEEFIYWIKKNGNDCYTSLDIINIERVRYGRDCCHDHHHCERKEERRDNYEK